jgi:hypothetical protein
LVITVKRLLNSWAIPPYREWRGVFSPQDVSRAPILPKSEFLRGTYTVIKWESA